MTFRRRSRQCIINRKRDYVCLGQRKIRTECKPSNYAKLSSQYFDGGHVKVLVILELFAMINEALFEKRDIQLTLQWCELKHVPTPLHGKKSTATSLH